MNRPLLYHPAALAEWKAEIAFCEAERTGAGLRIREDVARTLQMILAFPEIGRSKSGEIRRVVTSKYHFIIHYEYTDNQVVVWAIAHPAREPGYWQARRTS